jgi:hypothetical protein
VDEMIDINYIFLISELAGMRLKKQFKDKKLVRARRRG